MYVYIYIERGGGAFLVWLRSRGRLEGVQYGTETVNVIFIKHTLQFILISLMKKICRTNKDSGILVYTEVK
jgi:hypothetical protein